MGELLFGKKTQVEIANDSFGNYYCKSCGRQTVKLERIDLENGKPDMIMCPRCVKELEIGVRHARPT